MCVFEEEINIKKYFLLVRFFCMDIDICPLLEGIGSFHYIQSMR
jgi:hypothetical protein